VKTLLVIAHPRRSSLTGQAADAFREAAHANGHAFELADLAQEQFDPVLREADEPDWDDPTRSIPRTCGARCSGSSATTRP
jgi:NAD(P)H dehydrogenase (quinone)